MIIKRKLTDSRDSREFVKKQKPPITQRSDLFVRKTIVDVDSEENKL